MTFKRGVLGFLSRAGAVAGLFLVFEISAAAGPTEDAARDATKKGTAAYNLGRFEEAAKHYEQAYLLVQDPALLFNVGQSYRLAGKAEMAINAYRAFLRTAPSDAPNRGLVEKRLAELERIVTDTKHTQAAPPTGTLVTEPGPRPVLAVSTRTAELSTALDLHQAAPAANEPEQSPIYTRWGFWAGVGAVVVAGTVAAVMLSSGGGGAASAPATPLGNQDIFR